MTVLDWSTTGSVGAAAPCVVCGKPALCRSPKGAPCHKTCAEAWTDTHPNTNPNTRQGKGSRGRRSW
jgi:hypothetical protein